VRTKGGDRTCPFVHDRQSATTGEDKSHIRHGADDGRRRPDLGREAPAEGIPRQVHLAPISRPQWRLIRPLILLRDLRRTMPGRRGIKRALGNRDYLGFKSPGYGR
jgi:hypothetical protein